MMGDSLLGLGAIAGTLVAVAGARTRWRAAALWMALALVGYAASLTLVDAGPHVRYQHLRPPGLWVDSPLALAVLVVQAMAAGGGLLRNRSRLRALVAGNRPVAALIFVAVAFALTSATLSADPAVYAVELVTAAALQTLHLATAVMVALSVPADAGPGRLAGWLFGPDGETGRRPRLDPFVLGLAAFAMLAPMLLAVLSYERHPHIPDEVVYLLHARYLAAGKLGLALPVPFEAFDIDLMFAHRGRWVSPFPVGWPAVLAAGVWLGVPWLVNPLLNGVNVLLVYLLLHEICDRRTARVGVVLFALSPWNLLLGMSLLAHQFTLFAVLVAALGVARWKRGGTPGWALVAGVGIGTVSLIRPLDGFIVGALLGLWSLGARPWRRLVAGVAALGAGTVAIGGLGLAYNAAITGSPTRFPVMAYFDQVYGAGSNALGFGPGRGVGWSGLDPFPGHDLFDAVINSNLNLFALNVELLGWGSGALWLVALGLVAGRWGRGEWLMVATILGVTGFHALYWFSGGPDFGPRYWYLTVVPCVALAARGVLALGPRPPIPGNPVPALGLVGTLVAGSLIVFIPWRATDKYHGYRGMRPDLAQLADSADFGRSLVLVNGRRAPDLASASVFNPLDLDAAAPIYAWDRDPAVRRALLERYPDRPVWLLDGPTVAAGRFVIRAGPIPPGRLNPDRVGGAGSDER